MVKSGFVVEVGEKLVKVRIERQSACGGNCAGCLGCPADAKIIECPYRGSLVKGDRVKLVMSDGKFFKNVFWGYGLPTLMTVFGAAAGYVIFNKEGASVLGAALGLAAGLLAARLIFKRKNTEITAVAADKIG